MVDDTHTIDNVFWLLPEHKKLSILRDAGIVDDRPDVLRKSSGVFSDEISRWIAHHRLAIAASLLRVSDPSDRQIEQFFGDGDLPLGSAVGRQDIEVSVAFNDEQPVRTAALDNDGSGILITALSASSIMLTRVASVVSASLEPLSPAGVSDPPTVRASAGSVSFGFSGSLLTSGIGLLVACSAGLVTAPLMGPIGGSTLVVLGAFSQFLNWKKTRAEERKLNAETEKLRLDSEIARLELEKKRIDSNDGNGLCYSSLVPVEVVREESERFGFSEGAANHVLNRSIPTYFAFRPYVHHIQVDIIEAERDGGEFAILDERTDTVVEARREGKGKKRSAGAGDDAVDW